MPDPFGSFNWLCSHTPLPQCNLFFSQLYNDPTPDLTILFPSNSTFFEEYHVTLSDFPDDPNVMAARSDAGVGIGSNCQIPRAGQKGSLGDIALIVLSALSMLLIGYLLVRGNVRKAAVGRVELRTLFAAYILNLAFQIITMTSLFEQGTLVLSILSSIHLGVYVLLFWLLLVTAIVSTQWIDDGSPQSLVSSTIIGILLFSATLYISLDTSQQWTDTFTLGDDLVAKTLFVLTLIWPAFAWIAFVITMISVSIIKLSETKPALMQFLAALLFAGSQIVFFLASEPLCNASKGKINSSFLCTLLHTASMVVIYFAWESITEADFLDADGQSPYGQPQYGNTYSQTQYGNTNGYQYGHDNDGFA